MEHREPAIAFGLADRHQHRVACAARVADGRRGQAEAAAVAVFAHGDRGGSRRRSCPAPGHAARTGLSTGTIIGSSMVQGRIVGHARRRAELRSGLPGFPPCWISQRLASLPGDRRTAHRSPGPAGRDPVAGVVRVGPATPRSPLASATAGAAGSDGSSRPGPGMSARLRRSPLVARLAGGALFSLVGAVLARGLAFVATAVGGSSHRRLGEFGTIQLTAGALGVFAGLGLGVTATRALAQWRMLDPGRAGRILALALLIAAVGGALFGAVLARPRRGWRPPRWRTPGSPRGWRSPRAAAARRGRRRAERGAGRPRSLPRPRRDQHHRGRSAFPALVVGVLLGGRDGAVWGLMAGWP